MKTLPFLIILSSIISTGYLQELGDYYNYGGNYLSGFPFQIAQDPARLMRRRPCQHRRSYTSDNWFPAFVSKETEPLNGLQPQALKNDNADNNQAPGNSFQREDTNNMTEHTDIEQNNDAAPEDFLYGINRRSNVETPDDINELPLEEGYDCDIEFGTDEDSDPRSGNTQMISPVTGEPMVKTTVSTEQKVIDMLKDCLNKKQKHNGNKVSPSEDILIAGSRRSMGHSDIDNENDDETIDTEERLTTTDTNVKTTDNTDIETNGQDIVFHKKGGNVEIDTKENKNVPDKIYTPLPNSLYPGKLFNELQHPAKGTVIPEASRRMLVDDTRVCYACSSATNPSCWAPDSRTTVKYCRKEQNCMTKFFGVKNSLTVIRDCARSCDDTSVPGIEPKYKDCKVCHSDLCNSAYINSYSLSLFILITVIKSIF